MFSPASQWILLLVLETALDSEWKVKCSCSLSPAVTEGLDSPILSFLRIKFLSFREQLRTEVIFRCWTEIPLVQFFFFFFLRGGDVIGTSQVLRVGHLSQAGRAWGLQVTLFSSLLWANQPFSPLCQMHMHLCCGPRDGGTNTE